MNILKKSIHACCVIALLTFSYLAYAAQTVIDVLVVYSKGVADLYEGDPSTRINQLFEFTNQIYVDSGIDLKIRMVGTMVVEYTDDSPGDEALRDITYVRDDVFKEVSIRREAAKADMVIFYRSFRTTHNSCGEAWVGGVDTQGDFSDTKLKNFMYAHVPINVCGDDATAHELGHNMGLRHSRKQDAKGGTFDFALGYGELNSFTTIMAYQTAFNADHWEGKVYKFSSPLLDCKGVPCGVSRQDPVNGADAAYTLSVTAPQIASYYSDHSNSKDLNLDPLPKNESSEPLKIADDKKNIASSASSKSSSSGGGSSNFLLLIVFIFCFISRHFENYQIPK